MNIQKQSTGWQHGGTLLGLIIGLIIGLAIAVVVALVITKGATPFTNKGGKQEKAAEPTADQVADPNKPLYGNKDAAKEAAKDFAKEPDANTGMPTQNNTADPLAAKKADAKQADLKLPGDKAVKVDKPGEVKDVSKDAAAKTDSVDDKIIYYLQAGAFKDQSDAENTRAKLALLGVEAKVSDRTSDTGVLYRVRIGPFNQVDAMNKVRSKLSENGVDVAVVRNSK